MLYGSETWPIMKRHLKNLEICYQVHIEDKLEGLRVKREGIKISKSNPLDKP